MQPTDVKQPIFEARKIFNCGLHEKAATSIYVYKSNPDPP